MKRAYISKLAGQPLIEYLTKEGYYITLVTEHGLVSSLSGNKPMLEEKCHVDPRIATHPDIYMCQMGLWEDAGIFIGDGEKLGPVYPEDIRYNAVCTKDYYIHIMPGTDDDLAMSVIRWRKELAYKDTSHKDEHMKFIGVNQGYTRCTCLPVDDRSFITSDEGLADALINQGADILLIEQGHILLPGFDYGFIGGCAGHIYTHELAETSQQKAIIFNGDLSAHPDFNRIVQFIQSRNIHPIYFPEYPLEDIGSILTTM